ncbi:MAG: hypothetical protein NTU97_00115, partial [Candidatus Magasanikbacteria bacterium]|nr:hypothetical protein [Candidatus Magasanikbacteria bacterium]
MFKKKIFSLTLLIVLSLGFFYSPVVLAQSGDAPAETIQDCFTKAQTERQDCYGTNTPETLA